MRPATLVVVDLEGPPPPLEFDGVHLDAWVVARRDAHPRALWVVDLTKGPDEAREEILARREECHQAIGEPRSTVLDAELPAISVIVPTVAQRLEELDDCLSGIAAQEYPRFEILLVDNRRSVPSPDPLADISLRWPQVTLVRQPVPGISAARNQGLRRASHEVVAFTDDDVTVGPDWLRRIGEAFVRDPALDAVTGLILPAELETPAQLWFEAYYGGFAGERGFEALTLSVPGRRSARITVTDDAGREVRHTALYGAGAYGAGANMAYRRRSLAALGDFDEALGTGTPSRGGEDLAVIMSILWSGGRCRYEPYAYVFHRHRREIDELLHQLDGYGVGFTAAMLSLIMRDPFHLWGFARNAPLVLRQGLRALTRVLRRRPDDEVQQRPIPSEFSRREYRGYFKGPAAYRASRRLHRPTGAVGAP